MINNEFICAPGVFVDKSADSLRECYLMIVSVKLDGQPDVYCGECNSKWAACASPRRDGGD